MPSLIDIIIRATWAGGAAAKQARQDLTGIDDGAKKGGRGLESFATKAAAAGVVIGTVTVATKALYNELQRGASLELTQQRFDRLAESIGTTGDALRSDLAGATAGLLSDAQQMALATDLVALGLATDADQVVRLSRVVTELDQDIGELTLALANQTTRRFDQLGISVFGFQERLEDLQAQGLSTEEAFTEAFLQQAEEQIERVGGKAGTAAGELQEMEAAIMNVKDAAAEALLDVVRFAGGFDDIGEATAALDELAEKIKLIGDNFNDLLFISRGVRTITNPFGNVAGLFESIKDTQRELSEEFEGYLEQNEDYQNILNNVLSVLYEIEGVLGVDIVGDMEAAVEEAESFDRALMNANNTTVQFIRNLEKLSGVSNLPSRTGTESGIAEFRETQSERAGLFQAFQDDITSITEAAQQERAAIEEQYESQRTAVIENYNRQRAEEEADWQRRRARQEEDFRARLEDVQEQAAESQRDARSEANNRLEDLERDHLRRLQDIIDNANLQLSEAAGRLDAAAVARIIRQRDAAINQENRNYQDQRREIQEQLDEQLKTIRDNLDKRLADLQEFHEKQQEREEEDRQIRLERLEEAHRRELRELDDQYRTRIQDLKAAIRQERQARTQQYIDDYNQLTTHWSDRQELEAQWQAQILEQEREWWRQRSAIVGGDGLSGRGDSGGGATGGGGAGGGGAVPPTRDQINRIFIDAATAAGTPDNIIQGTLQSTASWSDERFAKWIERIYQIDVPYYQQGISFVPRTGLAMVHEGERIISAAENRRFSTNRFNQSNITLNIHSAPGMDERRLADYTIERLTRHLEAMT